MDTLQQLVDLIQQTAEVYPSFNVCRHNSIKLLNWNLLKELYNLVTRRFHCQGELDKPQQVSLSSCAEPMRGVLTFSLCSRSLVTFVSSFAFCRVNASTKASH